MAIYDYNTKSYQCFSCYNCKIACPNDAILIIESYHVDAGFFKTKPYPLPAEMSKEIQQNGMKLRRLFLLGGVFELFFFILNNYSIPILRETSILRILRMLQVISYLQK